MPQSNETQNTADKLAKLNGSLKQEAAYANADAKCKHAFAQALRSENDPQQHDILRAQALQYIESVKEDPFTRGQCPEVIPGTEHWHPQASATPAKKSHVKHKTAAFEPAETELASVKPEVASVSIEELVAQGAHKVLVTASETLSLPKLVEKAALHKAA